MQVELSELTAKLQSTHQQSEVSMETLQRTVRNLEHKVGMAQGELATTQAALAQCQQEYDSYKVSLSLHRAVMWFSPLSTNDGNCCLFHKPIRIYYDSN